jgi:hypothetical protein
VHIDTRPHPALYLVKTVFFPNKSFVAPVNFSPCDRFQLWLVSFFLFPPPFSAPSSQLVSNTQSN